MLSTRGMSLSRERQEGLLTVSLVVPNRTASGGLIVGLVAFAAFAGLVIGFGCVLLPPVVPLGFMAVVGLFLLWVMPDLQKLPRRWTSLALYPFVASIMCVPVYYAIILPFLPWISIRRAVLYAMIIPFCIILSGSSNTRSFLASIFKHSKPILYCTVGYVAMLIVSTLFSLRIAQSINFDIMILTTCILPMLVSVFAIRGDAAVEKLFKILITCVMVNFVIGTIEHFLQRPFLINALPSYMREQLLAGNPQAMVSLVTGQGLRGGMYRSSSTFTGSLTWGEATAMIAPMCLHYIAHGKSGTRQWFGFFGIALCALSIFFSGSRGAYVGFIVASVAYSIIWSLRACRFHPENLAGRIWLFLYMVGSGVTVLAVLFVPRIHNLVLGGGDAQVSTDGRYVEWAMAQPKILARPLWGYGGGTASEVIGYAPSGVAGDATTVDGYFMNLLVDHGIPGFLLFSGIFFSAAAICLIRYYESSSTNRAWGAAVGTSILAFIVYRITLSQIDNLGFAFVLVGLAVVYNEGAARGGSIVRRSRSTDVGLSSTIYHRAL